MVFSPSALVLAAGFGTRLDPLTRLVAKPAVPMGDRSLIEHVLAWLERNGVRDVVINLHHRPESVTALVGDGAHLGLLVRYSWEDPVLGSGGGPRRALPLLSSNPFLIVNGDTLANVDIRTMIQRHAAMGGDVTMAVVPNQAPDHYNGIRAGKDGEILGFVPKGQATGTWHFIGVQLAERSVFSSLPDGVAIETVAGVYRDFVAAAPGRLRVWPANVAFLDVGTPRDYLEACLEMAGTKPARGRTAPGSGAAIDPLRRTVIWADARVPPTANLDNAIIAGPVAVPDHFTASNVVVVPREVVRTGEAVNVIGNAAVFPLL